MEARREILLKYSIIGEVHPGFLLMDAVHNEDTALDKVNLRSFSESVRSGLAYQSVVLHPQLLGFYERLLDAEPRAYDMRYAAISLPGQGVAFTMTGPT